MNRFLTRAKVTRILIEEGIIPLPHPPVKPWTPFAAPTFSCFWTAETGTPGEIEVRFLVAHDDEEYTSETYAYLLEYTLHKHGVESARADDRYGYCIRCRNPSFESGQEVIGVSQAFQGTKTRVLDYNEDRHLLHISVRGTHMDVNANQFMHAE